MKAVIYARYSSDSQREESIEGQIRECTEYAEKNGITILHSYIGRAKPKYAKEQIVRWISRFKYGDADSVEYRKRIIDTFVNAVFLFDDKLVITYNFKGGTETITLKDIEAAYGSDLKAVSPPKACKSKKNLEII